MRETRKGTYKFYKGSYFIVFYDKTDENLEYMFDNVRDILKFMKVPVTRGNVCRVNNEIYRALKTDTHFIRFLDGQILRVHLVDIKEDK